MRANAGKQYQVIFAGKTVFTLQKKKHFPGILNGVQIKYIFSYKASNCKINFESGTTNASKASHLMLYA
jgi:hypothetical protein